MGNTSSSKGKSRDESRPEVSSKEKSDDERERVSECVSNSGLQNLHIITSEEEDEKEKEKTTKAELTEEELRYLLLKSCLNGDLDSVKVCVAQGMSVDSPEVLDPLIYQDDEPLSHSHTQPHPHSSLSPGSNPSLVSSPKRNLSSNFSPTSPGLGSGSISHQKKNFISPMIAAITGGRLEILEYLVSCGCSVDKSFQQVSESNGNIVTGVTPLMLACQRKHLEIISFLLAARADCSAVDSENNTVLHYVCRHQQKQGSKRSKDSNEDEEEGNDVSKILQLLKQQKVLTSELPGCSNIRNNTPLHSLSYFNNIHSMKLLLEVMYGSRDLSSGYQSSEKHFHSFPPPTPSLTTLLKNDVGMTPLHVAVLRSSPNMVQLLLDYAFDPDVEERSGLNVFQLAKVVNIQQSAKEVRIDDEGAVNTSGKVVQVLENYKEAIEKQKEDEIASRDRHVGFEMNASSITFDNTVDEMDDHGTESTSSLKDDYKSNVSRSASLTDNMVGSFSSPRQVNPYPKGKQLTRKEGLLRAAQRVLNGESRPPRSTKKKKKSKKGPKSPRKERQVSPLKSKQYQDSPFVCGTSGNHKRSLPGSVSPRSLNGTAGVAPSKHSRTAHSSQVHRGRTAAKMISSSRHLRAKSGWPTTPRAGSNKISPAPSTLRGHRGGKVQPQGGRSKKAAVVGGAFPSVKLPSNIHTSPSGVLTITFS